MNKLPDDFDPDEYLRLHKDVAAVGMDPVRHYLVHGLAEGRRYKASTGAKNKNSYQSFSSKGSSDSKGKLEALQLDKLPNRSDRSAPLEGMSVLDIGCNEGFFCNEAKRLGAARVLGIDKSKEWISRARNRFPDIEFMDADWWSIPDERFDVILFLSAVHYERDQKKLFDKLIEHLTEDGVLVLECGVVRNMETARWTVVSRAIGDRPKFPTKKLLEEGLLSSYATRSVGPSVGQKGDPIARYVFHCQRKMSTVIIVGGATRQGKSILSAYFAGRGTPKYSTDEFLPRALNDEQVLGEKAHRQLNQASERTQMNLASLGEYIIRHNLAEQICEAILEELPIELPYLLLEGEFLRHPEVAKIVEEGLKAKAVRVWHLSKSG